MVKVNYFFQGFIGSMMTKEFATKAEARQFLEHNKEIYNPNTASIIKIL